MGKQEPERSLTATAPKSGSAGFFDRLRFGLQRKAWYADFISAHQVPRMHDLMHHSDAIHLDLENKAHYFQRLTFATADELQQAQGSASYNGSKLGTHSAHQILIYKHYLEDYLAQPVPVRMIHHFYYNQLAFNTLVFPRVIQRESLERVLPLPIETIRNQRGPIILSDTTHQLIIETRPALQISCLRPEFFSALYHQTELTEA